MKKKTVCVSNVDYPISLVQNLNDSGKIDEIVNKNWVNNDLIISLFGRHLGEGTYRHVFEYNLDLNYVIKYEHGHNQNLTSNISEYLVYKSVLETKDPEIIKWFAKVLWISPNNKILVMEKTTPFSEIINPVFPKRIPKFLPDLKVSNYGFIGNQLKCHDYGSFVDYNFSKQMEKLKW